MLYAWALESNSSFLDKTPKHEELKEEVQDFTSPKLEIFLLQKSPPRSEKKKKAYRTENISTQIWPGLSVQKKLTTLADNATLESNHLSRYSGI